MRALSFALALFFSSLAIAAPHFPALTGRVVDDAHMLSASAVQSLDGLLADYERGTGNQVVVVTLDSLQGDAIEDYGYRLGRAWGIGQKGKDNGVLLIVAPHERKVRIEVGYGLEPVLTDAAASVIINSVILPDFRAGNMEQGVIDGTQAMLSVLGGKGMPAPHGPSVAHYSALQTFLGILLLLLPFVILRAGIFFLPLGYVARLGSSRLGGSGWGGGGGFGGGGFSGFSGGGGGFGGGGASGGW